MKALGTEEEAFKPYVQKWIKEFIGSNHSNYLEGKEADLIKKIMAEHIFI